MGSTKQTVKGGNEQLKVCTEQCIDLEMCTQNPTVKEQSERSEIGHSRRNTSQSEHFITKMVFNII